MSGNHLVHVLKTTDCTVPCPVRIMPFLQSQTLPRLSGQSVLMFDHSHSERFSYLETGIHVFQFLFTASCPVILHHWGESSSTFFKLSNQLSLHVDKIHSESWAFSFPSIVLQTFVWQMLQVPIYLCDPSLYSQIFLILWIPGVHTVLTT